MGYEKMKNWPNQSAPSNRRPRLAFATWRKFDYRFCPPPPLSAAVGEPHGYTFCGILEMNPGNPDYTKRGYLLPNG